MDKELKEMLNSIIEEIGRVEEKVDRNTEMLKEVKKDINLLKARNDFTDLYALYNQLDKRISELEKRVS